MILCVIFNLKLQQVLQLEMIMKIFSLLDASAKNLGSDNVLQAES